MPMHVLWRSCVCFRSNRMRSFSVMVMQMQMGRAAAMAVEMGMAQNCHSTSHRRIEQIVIVTMRRMFVLDKFGRPGVWAAIMIDGHHHREAMGLGDLFDG